MGNEHRTVSITYTMSRHNSARDLRDNALVPELLQALRLVCQRSRFEPLGIVIDDPFGGEQEFVKEAHFYEATHAVLSNYIDHKHLDEAIYALWIEWVAR